METKYDIIVNFFLNNWYFAVIVFICVVLIAIPQVRDGIKVLCGWIKGVRKKCSGKYDVYIYKSKGEKVIMTRILKSEQLDVIIVDTISHDLGIQSEHAWLKKYYSKWKYPMQHLSFVQTNQGDKMFDVFPISYEKENKDIYFDITNFYYEPIECLMDKNEYNKYKIKRLYRKVEK